MKSAFYIVGPTATGKSEIGAAVARECSGEIISADAFQIYAGLDLLTGKPGANLLRPVRHHLLSAIDPSVEMNAEEFRHRALRAIREIHARGRQAFVVGGSGMYVQALTDGLSRLPPASVRLRAQLEQFSEGELFVRLKRLDRQTAHAIDRRNKRRLVRAVEICFLSGRPASTQRRRAQPARAPAGVFLFRDRADLYERINARVELMFAYGGIEEVRAVGELGATARKTLGLEQIRALLQGNISEAECIASIQQATRRYAKRQLTWFQRQSNFEPLNLSLHGSSEAIEWITRKARLSFTPQDD